MMQADELAAQFPSLAVIELEGWIERRWVRPEPADGGGWAFQEVDVARVRLIYDLRYELDIAEETLPLVLSLVDQLDSLRWRMKSMLEAVEAQPEPVRRAILAVLREE